ncbi:hypothetical protein CC85DRAFT_4526 [Cutaneotrichosporon oleaginosum]|uniref:Uncharacterized protein n=1 Tax=Cutaneotrichosporon oleaginosum TaxID=879819 RepID=A0A0J0XZP5_9TREE|nr:uncharacterized protein CC85DRAFT_4526 [Cutaneotrichosporon oleaginosum]KLT46515.1 hypothetical protein CC85DRAFT_4526 [Cutaneotrichosporon oleaginosum]TXT15118.1 hypothetical protein COLE_01311 [Cutaneotrichosporon oleaginosum]
MLRLSASPQYQTPCAPPGKPLALHHRGAVSSSILPRYPWTLRVSKPPWVVPCLPLHNSSWRHSSPQPRWSRLKARAVRRRRPSSLLTPFMKYPRLRRMCTKLAPGLRRGGRCRAQEVSSCRPCLRYRPCQWRPLVVSRRALLHPPRGVVPQPHVSTVCDAASMSPRAAQRPDHSSCLISWMTFLSSSSSVQPRMATPPLLLAWQ